MPTIKIPLDEFEQPNAARYPIGAHLLVEYEGEFRDELRFGPFCDVVIPERKTTLRVRFSARIEDILDPDWVTERVEILAGYSDE
jgi:hypothetical protein